MRLGGGSVSALVSIGIPFRDAEGSLGDAVRSVFAQTHQKWELLLIDDGSSDTSLAVARSIVDPRVTLRADGARRGLANRLNEIAHAATGTYLARMDADDLMHPERIRRQLEFLEAHADVDVVGTACISLGPDDEPVGSRAGSLPEPYTRASILSGAQLAHPTVMARTRWFRSHPYDARFERAEDIAPMVRDGHLQPLRGSIRAALFLSRGRVLRPRRSNALMLKPPILRRHEVLAGDSRKQSCNLRIRAPGEAELWSG